MKAKPYPKYKDSGIEWLGDVPEHWDLKRSDTIIESERQQLSPESFADEDVFHYSIPAVQEFGTGLFEKGESISSAKQIITEPVVLISKLNPRKATICRAVPKKLRTLASTEFIALKARKCDLRFLEYLVSTESFRQRLDSCVQSVTRSHQRVNPDQVYRFWTAWPSPDEQRTIAEFLDRETARIDALVAKKRELIERLKEKRSALISQTVTRGLPPKAAAKAGLPVNPRLKPSGVDWLGDVPDHWEVKKFGYISAVVRGASPRPAGDPRYFDGDFIPWITVGEVTKDTNVYLTSTDTMLTEEGALNSRTIRTGTLVLTNSGATLGVPKILAITGCANDGIVAFEYLSKKSNQLFLYYFLHSLTESLRERIKQGSGQPNLNTEIVKALPVPLPPIAEQATIAAFLNMEVMKLDLLVAKAHSVIECLQEYRTALITAAVTGKIDVRNHRAA